MVSKALRNRLVWLIVPIGAYLLVVWVLHPANSNPAVLQQRMLAGFLFGLCYGLFLWRDALLMSMFRNFKAADILKNQWPDRFYIGRTQGGHPTPAVELENEDVKADE